MTIIFLVAVIALFIGYLLGNLKQPAIRAVKKRISDPELERQKREYENFLNYDGTEQS